MQNQIPQRLTAKVWLISISLMLVSCSSKAVGTPIPTQHFPIIEPTSPTLPSRTLVFTPTIVLTETPTPTNTLTPPPTLSLELSEHEVRNLMRNDTACKPPCFLGVVPERTTRGELENVLQRFRLSPAIYEDIVYNIYNYSDNDIPPHTQFFINDGLVNSIKIDIEQVNEFEWSLFSPASVVERFGAPSFVTFGLQVIHEPTLTPWKAWYLMTFYYDDLDFIIQYGLPEIRLDELITVCPNKDDFEYTRIWLGKNPDHPPRKSLDGPLEEVTSFTLESFREYLLLGAGACFYLKASAIPIY
jgi:hypothetical protein